MAPRRPVETFSSGRQRAQITRFVDAEQLPVMRDDRTALRDWLVAVLTSTRHWSRGGDVTVE